LIFSLSKSLKKLYNSHTNLRVLSVFFERPK